MMTLQIGQRQIRALFATKRFQENAQFYLEKLLFSMYFIQN